LNKLHVAGEQLFALFTQELAPIEDSDKPVLLKAEAAIDLCRDYLGQLKTLAQQYGFADKAEEIYFFKHTKPPFLSSLIYYTVIFNICSHWPEAGETLQCAYLKRELNRIKQFFTDHQHIHCYYRTNSTYLDEQYFVRGNFDIRLIRDSFYFEADTSFSTGYDYTFARIAANQRLVAYLENLLLHGENRASLSIPSSKAPSLTWTGSKADAVELIYALHATGVFNNAQADVKSIATCFEQTFHIQLGNFYNIWQEIKMRKIEPTKLINRMTTLLQNRMEEKD
jgi:hypothetical protein